MEPYRGPLADLPYRVLIEQSFQPTVADDALNDMVDWATSYEGFGEWDCTVYDRSLTNGASYRTRKGYMFCFSHEQDALMFRLRFADRLAKY